MPTTTTDSLVPPTEKPHRSSDITADSATVNSANTTNANASGPPRLHFTFKPKNPLLYLVFLVVCNVLLPCLLYYLLLIYTKLEQRDVVGISSSALGLSSCFDAPFRVWKLTKKFHVYAPLNSPRWYHLDFTMWLLTYCVLILAIPLIVGPVVPVYNIFLMATPMLVLPIVPVFLYSLVDKPGWGFPWMAPPVTSSTTDVPTSEPTTEQDTSTTRRTATVTRPFPGFPHPPSTSQPYALRPAIYYILEDVVAVDFGYKRPWRTLLNSRYNASPSFRSHMRIQTYYWIIMALVHTGITSAVCWGASYHVAFGLVLGLFFIWAFVAGVGCWMIAKRELKKEWDTWEEVKTKEVA